MPLPKGRELVRTCGFGLMLLGVANGCLTFSEMWIPSSLAALFLTTAPFWLVGLESAMPRGEKLTLPLAIGLLVGLSGVVVLLIPADGNFTMSPNVWKGFLVLQVGSLFWNAGSILQRRFRGNSHPLVTGAVQQLAAGGVYFIAALFIPEHPIHLTATGVAGVVWLVTFGSIVGYSSYIYRPRNTAGFACIDLHLHQPGRRRGARQALLRRAFRCEGVTGNGRDLRRRADR